jgi:hypothetical protein
VRSKPDHAARIGLILALGAVVSLAGCVSVIDGQPVGRRLEADERFSTFAIDTLDRTMPGHAEVVAVELYEPSPRPLHRSGGYDAIVVLRMADDTVRALYVGCGVGVTDRCFLGPQE